MVHVEKKPELLGGMDVCKCVFKALRWMNIEYNYSNGPTSDSNVIP